ncbi:hypothetical protein Tco_0507635 [Tanacetum coccineum]
MLPLNPEVGFHSGGGGGGSVDVVSVVSITLEGTSADADQLDMENETCQLSLANMEANWLQIDLDALLARDRLSKRKKAAKKQLALNLITFKLDYMQIQFLQKSFNKRKGAIFLLRIESNSFYMTQLCQRKFMQHRDELKSKSFEEIHVPCMRDTRARSDFCGFGYEEDERSNQKDEMKHACLLIKRRKKKESIPLVFREDDDLKMCLHIAPDEDKVVDVEILDHQYPIVEWQSFFLTTKPQFDPTKPLEDDYMNRVTRSNGNMRFFRTLMGVLSIFDREDLKAVYELV